MPPCMHGVDARPTPHQDPQGAPRPAPAPKSNGSTPPKADPGSTSPGAAISPLSRAWRMKASQCTEPRDRVPGEPMTTRPRLGRVMATLRRRRSETKPIRPEGLHLGQRGQCGWSRGCGVKKGAGPKQNQS